MPTLAALEREASTCVRCALAECRTQVVFGTGDRSADLLVVGEGPGQEEDLRGEPFVGRSGQLLDRFLDEELGRSRRQGVYIANVVKCRPPANRDPRAEEAAACRPWLEGQIELVAPTVILTLGNVATRHLLETDRPIGALRGRVHPFRPGTVVVPTYHPSYVLRSGGAGQAGAGMRADLVRAGRALAEASA